MKLFGGTVPPNNFFGGGTLMEISFWYGKGDIPNENFRLPPLEVHFGIGGCGRTDSAGGGWSRIRCRKGSIINDK